MISAILACKIREAATMCLTESVAPYFSCLLNRRRTQRERERRERERREREREREREFLLWEERPHAPVSFRCIIFIFATSRIHKKHVQLGHADGRRGNKHCKQKPFACPRLMRILYMKSILGALGSWGSKAVT